MRQDLLDVNKQVEKKNYSDPPHRMVAKLMTALTGDGLALQCHTQRTAASAPSTQAKSYVLKTF